MTSAALDVGEGEHFLVLVGLETGAATMEISVVVPQKAGNISTT